MKVFEFIAALKRLPQDAEIAVLSATATARPPMLEKINRTAWSTGEYNGGLANVGNAYLVRPEREILK